MCGIVGFVAADPEKLGSKRMSFLKQALFVDSLRGMGGTGIACIDKLGSISTHKRALPGPDFLNSLVWDFSEKYAETSRITIGHNRAATIGSVKDKNCHPFHYKGKQEIVLVHNGTLSSYYQLGTNKFSHDVDSAYAAWAFAQNDNEMDVLKKIKGPFVFVWYNKTKGTFNIARNSFRDIHYMMSKEGDIFFSSEYMMLDWIMDRVGLEPKWKEFKNPEQDTWLEWSFAEDGSIKKPVCRKIKYETEVAPRPFRAGAGASGYIWGYDTERRESYPVWNYGTRETLKQYGFEYNETAYVELLTFERYERGDFGKATAMLVYSDSKKDQDEGWDVEISGMSYMEYNRWNKDYGEFFPITIDGIRSLRKFGDTVQLELTARPNKTMLIKWDNSPATIPEIPSKINELVVCDGLFIPLKEWKNRTKQGCANCSNPILEKDFDKLVWVEGANPPAVLCHVCSKDEQIVATLSPNNQKKVS